jgi:hypothetical protein
MYMLGVTVPSEGFPVSVGSLQANDDTFSPLRLLCYLETVLAFISGLIVVFTMLDRPVV